MEDKFQTKMEDRFEREREMFVEKPTPWYLNIMFYILASLHGFNIMMAVIYQGRDSKFRLILAKEIIMYSFTLVGKAATGRTVVGYRYVDEKVCNGHRIHQVNEMKTERIIQRRNKRMKQFNKVIGRTFGATYILICLLPYVQNIIKLLKSHLYNRKIPILPAVFHIYYPELFKNSISYYLFSQTCVTFLYALTIYFWYMPFKCAMLAGECLMADIRLLAKSMELENCERNRETSRENSEKIGKTGESLRENSENIGKTGESLRENSENIVKTGESSRENSEKIRKTEESLRQNVKNYGKPGGNAKSWRENSENIGKTGENLRENSENIRETEDSLRQNVKNYGKPGGNAKSWRENSENNGKTGGKFERDADERSVNYSRLRFEMSKIVTNHQNLYRDMNELNELFQRVAVGFINFYALQMCLIVLFIVKAPNMTQRLSLSLRYVIALSIMYACSLIGENIREEGKRLRMSIWQSPWVERPIWLRKTLTLMLTRATRDMEFRPYGLYALDIKCVIRVLQGTYTYFNVLKKVGY